MNILVTGATGFIGKAFVLALESEGKGHTISCAARKSSNTEDLELRGLKIVHFDMDDYTSFKPAVEGQDTVIHFATMFDFEASEKDLRKYTIEATEELARACLDAGVNHFIYCSTSEALGAVINGTEEVDYNPDTLYGKCKAETEKLLLDMRDNQGLGLTIVRPSGVFGPGDYYVVKEIIEAVYNGLVPVLPSSAKTTAIHFTYIDDIIQGFLKIVDNPDTVGKIYNLCSDKPQLYHELHKAILKALGRKPVTRYVPVWMAKVGMPLLRTYAKMRGRYLFPLGKEGMKKLTSSRSYSNAKAKKELGFKPVVDFEDGMKKTVEWMENEGLLSK